MIGISRTRTRTSGGFALLGGLWGLSFVAGRAAVADVPPVVLATLRFALAGPLVLVAAAVVTDRWRPRARSEWRVIAVTGLVFVAAQHVLLFAGQQYVTSAVAGVLNSLYPVLAVGFAWCFVPEECPDSTAIGGILTGLLGATVVAAPDAGSLASTDLRGIGLVLGSAAAFALGTVLVRRERTDLPTPTMLAWAMIAGVPVLWVGTLVLPGESFGAITWSPRAVWGLAYLVLGGGVVAYVLYFGLLSRLGAVQTTLVGYAAPVFAVLGGWLFLGEPVDPATIVGFALIVCGFTLVKREAFREELARRVPGLGAG